MKLIKLSGFAGLCVAAAIGLASWGSPSEGELKIGEFPPMLHAQLTDVDGSTAMLREYGKPQGLLVVFSCNTCPFVLQWEDRYNELYELCNKNEVGMVLVNSNEAKRDGDDSLEKMKQKAQAEGYKMPYVMDKDHVLADAWGARTTPHIYLFNQQMRLAYRGAIDDNSENREEVQNRYLADAINSMLKDEPINPEVTKSIGCSIKRVKQ